MARWATLGLHVAQTYSMVSMTSALSIRTSSPSGAVDRSYSSGRSYCLRRRLASSTRRMILTATSAFSHIIAARYTILGGLLVCLVGCLSNGSDPVQTFHHQARGLRLGSRTCQSERSTHCNDNSHRPRKAVPRSRNDARIVCTKHSPDPCRLGHSLLRLISP